MNVPRYKCSVRVLVCLDCESYARQPFIMSHSFTNRFTHAAWGLTQKGRSDKKKKASHSWKPNSTLFSWVVLSKGCSVKHASPIEQLITWNMVNVHTPQC